MNKMLPNNFELEKQVIGELMFLESIGDIKQNITLLNDSCFFQENTKESFQVLKKTVFENMIPDLVTMTQKLPKHEMFLFDASNSVATTANIQQHIHLLNDLHVRREIISNYDVTADLLFDCDNNSIELIENLSFQLKQIRTGSIYKQPRTTEETIRNVVKTVKEARENENVNIHVPYCLKAVDYKLKLLRKQMHILAGLPGTGKTAFALSCMVKQILSGYRVAYFCGESSSDEVMIRLAIIMSQLEFMDVITGLKRNSAEEITAFHKAMVHLDSHKNNFYVYGKGDYEHSIQDIEFIISEISGSNPLDAIYFDHLQNMRPPKFLAKESRVMQVEYNVREVNNLIGNYNVAGTLLCQLNREAKNTAQPNMSNLKYSSTIEEEAHVITFLHNANDKKSNKPTREIKWYSDKTRVQEEIYTTLAFRKKNMEYTGFYSKY